MLVLSRRLGEKILIGDEIAVTLMEIDRGKVRLGIEAPLDVRIWREELLPIDEPHPAKDRTPAERTEMARAKAGRLLKAYEAARQEYQAALLAEQAGGGS